jgi:hypothetical protein
MLNLLLTTNLGKDNQAHAYIKVETVRVYFAFNAGLLISRVGPNHFVVGDAIVSAADGEKWVVSRRRFDEKYFPVAPTQTGQPGTYDAKKLVVYAKKMPLAFSIAREADGDKLTGAAGDWLMQYAPGDFGVVLNARFQRIYQRLSDLDCR